MIRKLWFTLFVAAAVSVLLPAVAFAAGPTQYFDQGPLAQVWSKFPIAFGSTQHFGPFPSTSPDNGSCSVLWANDTFDRYFTVRGNRDGTIEVTQKYKNGTFVTVEGTSPGACNNTNTPHGSTVRAGVTGKFRGYVTYTVTGGTYNADGCDAAGNPCSTTAGFFAAVFPGGNYSGDTWSFEYTAPHQGLLYHSWKDASDPTLGEAFSGDIADR